MEPVEGRDPFESAKEMGARVRAAQAYLDLDQRNFGKLIGRSYKTVASIQKGEPGSTGRSPEQRRQLAEQIVRASNCPPEILGLSEAPADHRLARIEAELEQLRGLLSPPAEPVEDDEIDLEEAEEIAQADEDEDEAL